MKITWLGQGGFLWEADKFRLVADPYLSDCIGEAGGASRLYPFPVPLTELCPDYLLITHDHRDHLDPVGIPLIREAFPTCRYAGPERAFRHLLEIGIPEDLVRLAKYRQTFEAGPFRITPLLALHSDPTACGYLIEVENKRIWLSGDTLYGEDLRNEPLLSGLDLLLICINGKLGNMNDAEALQLTQALNPKTALPMHIDLFKENTQAPAAFITGCTASGIRSWHMEPGKVFTI